MIIPYVLSTSTTYYFEAELGVYNKDTFIFDVYYTQSIVRKVEAGIAISFASKNALTISNKLLFISCYFLSHSSLLVLRQLSQL